MDLRTRLEGLTSQQRALLRMRLRERREAEASNADSSAHGRLVAYVVASQDVTQTDLRRHLQGQLPDYMIPSAFVRMDALPRLPNGKVDLHALPDPADTVPDETDAAFTPPRTPVEQTLADIWAGVLGMEPISVHDNFFEIGGDSILSIQIIARAREAGLQLAPNHLFEYQTIAELAPVATPTTPTHTDTAVTSGSVPLTPIQHWFFDEHHTAPHHWNQAVSFDLKPGVQPGFVKQALVHLMRHHNALRLRFEPDQNTWNAAIAEPMNAVPFQIVQIPDAPPEVQQQTVRQQIEAAQASLHLSEPPLMRVLFFENTTGPAQLVLMLHHLITDVLSWNILIEDLATAYRQCSRQQAVVLPAGTTSFKLWADRLADYAFDDALLSEVPYWQTQLETRHTLPTDFEVPLPLAESSAETCTVTLDADATRMLLTRANTAYNTRTEDILLAALMQVLVRWTGQTSQCIGLEHHGRTPELQDMDLSRTVGWITSYFPLALTVGSIDPGPVLESVREQRRTVPNQGLGYGVLRYMRPDVPLPVVRPQVIFNYLGNRERAVASESPLGAASSIQTGARHPESERFHLFEINAAVSKNRLQVRWTYSRAVHRPETVERLARDFTASVRVLIAHCTAPDMDTLQLSDGPETDLSGETTYPLSAMQKALVFHHLSEEIDRGFLQVRFLLDGTLDPDLFRKAWDEVTSRHAALRTSIRWNGPDEPVQIIHSAVELPWTLEDHQALSSDERTHRLAAFLEADRAQGFDFASAPLSRITIFKYGPDSHQVVWSCHHVLLDGWSAAVLLRDVFLIYDARHHSRSPQLPFVPSYRQYLHWLGRQDRNAAERFWKFELQDYTTPVLIADPGDPTGRHRFEDISITLSHSQTTALQTFAQAHRLTLNTMIGGLWALLLGRYGGQSDVIFGATVSGRSAPVPGIERTAGLFMNVLPQRVRIDTDRPLADWLADVQRRQARRLPYEYVTLDQIPAWSEVPGHRPLFDSLIVFENFPWTELSGGGVSVRDFQGGFTTTYPLTIVVKPGPALTIQLIFDRSRMPIDRATRIGRDIEQVLELMLADPARTLSEIGTHIEELTTGSPPPTADRPYVPPQNELQLRLTRIWETVLGRHPIGIRDNFFDLGGQSLTALRIFARIEQELGKNLPPVMLFRYPTIEQMTGALDDEAGSRPWQSVVPLRTGGSKPPLFCLHAGGGHVMFYRLLADHLGPDQPVYGIQALGLDGKQAPLTRIEDMASHYLDELRQVQSEGPYHLVCRCFSNAVGLEMARQLRAQDQEVGLLVMLDSEPPPRQRPEMQDVSEKDLRYYLMRFAHHARHARWSVVRDGLLEATGRLAARLRRAWTNRYGDFQTRRLQAVMDGFSIATRNYTARPYAGKIIFIRSTEFLERPEKQGQAERWAGLAEGGLETFVITGRHDDLFDEPMVSHLAEHLKRCMV